MRLRTAARCRCRKRAFACATLGLSLAIRASSAHADDASVARDAPSKAPVRVERTECALAPLEDVMAVLRVEIAARLTDGPPLGAGYTIGLECADDAVTITAGVPTRPNRTYRTSLLGAPLNVRPRIVALAIAEIVRDLDRESALQSSEAPPSPPLAVPDGRGERDGGPPLQRAAHPVRMEALAQTSSFRLDGRWLGGGGLRFEYSKTHWVSGIDTLLLTTHQQFSFGQTETVLVYASPHAGWASGFGPFHVRAGAGFAAGVARLSGRATDPSFHSGTVSGIWTAPYAFVGLAFALAETVRVDAGAQAGWVTSPVVGEVTGGSDTSLSGLWTTAQVGLSLSL